MNALELILKIIQFKHWYNLHNFERGFVNDDFELKPALLIRMSH